MVKLTYKHLVLVIAILLSIVLLVVINKTSSTIDEKSTQTSSNFFNQDLSKLTGDNIYRADPNYQIRFPEDHQAHPNFGIEWWYLTANLEDQYKNKFGLQWTLFRFISGNNKTQINREKNRNIWADDQLYMAHASIHGSVNGVHKHWFSEKFARGGVGNAGVENTPFTLFIDDWEWLNDTSSSLFPATLNFNAVEKKTPLISNHKISANLTLEQTGPFVLHGDNGYSIKSSTGQHASHYYSAPFININGSLTVHSNGLTDHILKIQGQAWYDHEWTSQLLDTETLGWDWFSLHLENGNKIMAFRMRLLGQADYITGTFITSNGDKTSLLPDDISLLPLSYSQINGKTLPLTWQLKIKEQNIDIVITTIKEDQWNAATVEYYEGMVEFKGTHSGLGFIELTGHN